MLSARRIAMALVCSATLLLTASNAPAQVSKLLPDDTEMIVTINLQQILKSDAVLSNKELLDIVKGMLMEQLKDKGVTKYFQKANFDLFRDLNSITIGVPGGRNPEEGFIILEGRFNADSIEAAAVDANKDAGGNLKTSTIGGVKAFEIAPKEEQVIYIGILNEKTLIAASSKSDFAGAVERFSGSKKGALKSELKALMGAVPKNQSISAVATGSVLARLAENAPKGGGNQAKAVADAVKQLDGVSLGIAVQRNIDFQVGVNTKDAKTSSGYADMANLFITAARAKMAQQAKDDEKFQPMSDVLNTLRANAQGNNVMVRGQVSFDALGKMLQHLPIPKQ